MLSLCMILISHFYLLANARVYNHHTLVGEDGDLITNVCRGAGDFKANCSIILREDPKVVNANNYFDISKAILELAIRKTSAARNFMKELTKNNDSPAITACIADYEFAIDFFNHSLDELKESPATAVYDAKIVINNPYFCSVQLENAHIVNPSIDALNYQTSLLSVCASQAISYTIPPPRHP
ncbi:hypothetical protein Fmac_019667 [Flemingia macrophylla]|uniref:Pectinesterase inhibitor domain-containing protein n=1 Tax=Flemingia macrophylla TaxID=520843 RepID=A0ABD1M8L5_9FABA